MIFIHSCLMDYSNTMALSLFLKYNFNLYIFMMDFLHISAYCVHVSVMMIFSQTFILIYFITLHVYTIYYVMFCFSVLFSVQLTTVLSKLRFVWSSFYKSVVFFLLLGEYSGPLIFVKRINILHSSKASTLFLSCIDSKTIIGLDYWFKILKNSEEHVIAHLMSLKAYSEFQ